MKRLINNKIAASFGLTLAILVINAVVTYGNILKVIDHSYWVSHTNEVLASLERTLSTLINAETGQRGYIITGKENYLEPYNAAFYNIDDYVQQVKKLTADNPNQQQRIIVLEPKIVSRLNYLRQTIALRREKGFEAVRMVLLLGQGKQEMDEIRALIVEMENEERLLLQRRTKEARRSAQETIVTFSIASGVSLALLGLGFYLVKRDITERQRAEKILRESEFRFRRLVESNIMGVIFADFSGKIWQANDAFLQMLGYTREDLLLERVRWDAITPVEYRPLDERVIEEVKRKSVSSPFEKEYIRKDGTSVPVLIGVALLKESQDNCVCFVLDLSARKRAEEAQRRSAQRLAALHEIDSTILAAQSPEEIAQAALSRMRQLVPCQQAFVVLFNFEQGKAQVLAGSINGDMEPVKGVVLPLNNFFATEVLRQQGQTRYIEDIAVLPYRPPVLERRLAEGMHSFIAVSLIAENDLIGELNLFSRQPAAFNSEYRDIAREVADQLAIAIQQNRLREQLQRYAAELEQRVADRTVALQEANTELQAFTYSVSHDLRAPLRAMQGFAQALLEDYADKLDSFAQDYARRIVAAASRMDTLINDLLAYSRLSRAEIRLQPVSLAVVVAEALAQLEAELQERQAQVTVEESLPEVVAHRTTLIQVVTNLLANAVKFVAPTVKPQVRVWAEEREGWVRLWLQDNGIGIAPEHQQRIFRVFERLHGIETYPGTGIGLAIVRKGVERMGGRVGVKSQVGQGSRFWIELPQVEKA